MRRKTKSFPWSPLPVLFAITGLLCLFYYIRLHTSSFTDKTPISELPSPEPLFDSTASVGDSTIMTTSFSLSTSLAEKKRALLDRLLQPSNDSSPIVVIMGNEAGDTDSLASSILLSHLLSRTDSKLFPPSTTFVPLSQLPRDDLKLRSENEMLLSLLHLESKDLLFLDDLPSLDKLLRSDIFFGLTDHPQLSSYWQPYDRFIKKVEIVVDHHADDGAHKDAKVRVLKGPGHGAVGSAVSVVVDMFKDTKDMQELPSQLADLGLAAILIDTDDVSLSSVWAGGVVFLQYANL
jgi:exopolyphosphatase